MYGLISFYKKAKEKGIKPILGTYIDEPELEVMNDLLLLRRKETLKRVRGYGKIYAIFLAKNFDGYSDICRIITARKLKEDFSLFKLLQNEFPNLFILTNSIELLQSIPPYENIYAELIITESHKFHSRKLFEAAKQKILSM